MAKNPAKNLITYPGCFLTLPDILEFLFLTPCWTAKKTVSSDLKNTSTSHRTSHMQYWSGRKSDIISVSVSDPGFFSGSGFFSGLGSYRTFYPEPGSVSAKNPDPIRKIRIREKNVQKLEYKWNVFFFSYLTLPTPVLWSRSNPAPVPATSSGSR